MAIWIELGIFGLALAFGVWQLRDVAKARAQTQAEKAAAHHNDANRRQTDDVPPGA